MKLRSLLTFTVVSLFAAQAYAADSIADMFSEGSVHGQIRAFSYTYDNEGSSRDLGDNVIGGFVYYKTAPLHGISLGLTFATANNFLSDDNKGNYGLLDESTASEHKSYTKMMEYYIQGDYFDTTFKYGAQEIYTPIMNMDYCRLLPKTYKGLSIANKSIDNLELDAYYITGYSNWNDSDYMPIMSSVTDSDDENPLLIGGAKYHVPTESVNLGIEGWVYHMDDVFNSQMAIVNLSKTINDVNVSFIPSYLKQDSAGDDLAGKLDTYQYGFQTGVNFNGIDLKAYYSKTGDDALFTPWGFGKVIMQQYMVSGNRAEEDAYGVLVGYDLTKIGLTGLSAYVWYTVYDTPDSGSSATPDAVETDYNLQYKFGKNFNGALDGLSLEAGLADINYDGAEDAKELRLRLIYSFKFGKNS
ncbi:OprD family outer membrane porin [Seleniivibrio sp.]|uniref:OprD family outer membrane porin n=1 Tax=Seleniivibrio sp. TaxID=2898801 RepID=UPI0025FC9583|nr:OprD family outer membrane porin [Seleniivibrio sp.]MCD8554768.1 OprD family outer membrane porin [Seleniivibrio sp.]